MSRVIPFPQRIPKTTKRDCTQCAHAYVGISGVYCSLYREEVWQPDRVAEECAEYESTA